MSRRLSQSRTGAAVLSLAVASAQAAVPPIPVKPESELVGLIAREVDVGTGCVLIAEKVSVLDGLAGSGQQAFEGTRERALQLLRNKAVQMNANTARILSELTTV